MTVLLLLLSYSALAETYYVRPDGGTGAQCNGLADDAYPGSGSDRSCAWAHPYWALTAQGAWRLQGGDTLLVQPGSYMMGYGAPNTGWCNQERSYECGLPALPSGPSKERPTRLAGMGWDKGCHTMPELWGNEGVRPMLSLARTSNAMVACFEITDHSSCLRSHPNPAINCPARFPFGPFTFTGIYAVDSANVTLRNLNIHGLAHTGIQAGRLKDWTVEDVRIAGNGRVGWDGDLDPETDSSNSGTLVFRRWKVEWNGCSESYPDRQYTNCWAQKAGGYGDGVATARSSGRWLIEDSEFRYNTSDGLDLLYLDTVNGERPYVEIQRTVAMGNAGNQVKISGSALVVNSVLTGNCAFFVGKPFAELMGDKSSTDHCRAEGAALLLSIAQGDTVYVVNNTITGEGDGLMSSECRTAGVPGAPPCLGTEKVHIQNNILVGYGDWRHGDVSALTWDPDGFSNGRTEYNLLYQLKNTETLCAAGGTNICAAPYFRIPVLEILDPRLNAGSPAIDSGLEAGSMEGRIPAEDIAGVSRPRGAGVDRGAHEFRRNQQ